MRKRMTLLLVLFGLFFALALASAQEVQDPYLWLEEVDGAQALEWVKAKNAETQKAFKSHPDFQSIVDKSLAIHNAKERIAYPSIVGDWTYNFWKDQDHPRGIWRRATLESYLKGAPAWETVLDIDALSKKEGQMWVFSGATWLRPDYKRCMIGLSPGGGDAVEYREFDAEKKTFIQDGFFLPTSKGGVSWIDTNTLIVGTNFGEGTLTTSGYPRITKHWKRGTPLSEAVTVFEGETEDMGVWGHTLNTPERQYEFVLRMLTFYEMETYAVEQGKPIKLEIPGDARMSGVFKGQMLINLKSDWTVGGQTFPQGAIISIGYDAFLKGDRNFTLMVAPEPRSSIDGTLSSKNQILVNMLTNVRSTLWSYTWENGQWHKQRVDAPSFGTLGVTTTDDASDRYFFNYQDFLTPSTLYYVADRNAKPAVVKSLPAFFDASNLEVTQHEVQSKDGTRIPYFMVAAKGLKTDGSHPTLLYGYGGFEISQQPYYNATIGTHWLERGGVYVVANIRGGGEFGPAWHQAGLKENRQRVYDDFIAVAEDLVNRKVTSPKHLACYGGSNGGLLVGVMFTQRPDLFGGVVCAVPLLDMKRYSHLLAGASWMGEYGNPDIPEEWAYISRYSPYQNLHADKKYPKVFFTTSTRDDRVHPGHARKMAKKMEDMGHGFYYFENIEGGHGGVSTNDQRAFRDGLMFVYLWTQLK